MPGRSALVESPHSSSRPSRPSSASRADVRRHAVHRRLVELVVARDQRRAELAGQRHRERVRDRVGHLHHLHRERPGVEGRAGEHVLHGTSLQAVLVELRAHHRRGQRAAVDRRRAVELAQHEGQRAHVVLVPVGEHDRLDVVGALAQVGEVGQHEVDPELVGRGEHQARCPRPRSGRRTRRPSCSCRSRPARRAGGPGACRAAQTRGQQAVPLERGADHGLSSSRPQRAGAAGRRPRGRPCSVRP